jgi:signal transduction histidine kinase
MSGPEQNAGDPAQARIAALERKVVTLEKINQALMGRVERSTNSIGDSYSMFVHNLTLQRHVEQQTRDLQESNRQLQGALSNLQSATDQMIQSEKLAALGSLVAGIAHEVNTPLGISVTAASHLEEQTRTLAAAFAAGTMKKSDLTNFIGASQETVRIILGNLMRAANLIQSFKKIAVDQSSEAWQTVGLESYLKDIIVSLTPKLKKTKVTVSPIQCPENLRINTMPGALSQIITNLVTNSLQHGFNDGQEGEIVIAAKTRKQSVVLTYADNGKGIPDESLGRIFEPFFTTARGKGGSGLGLHLVYNIVTRSLKGSITVHSKPGEGVKFTLLLPDCVLIPDTPPPQAAGPAKQSFSPQ